MIFLNPLPAMALLLPKAMSSVSLSNNGIGEAGAKALARLFSHCKESEKTVAARKAAKTAVDRRNKWVLPGDKMGLG